VVLGIDGSKGAARAADWLKQFPLPEECEVRLVTAVPQLELLLPFGGGPWPAEFQTYCREEGDKAKQRLEDLATSFTLIGKPCSAQVRPGDPADALLRSAEEEKADLLVVGSHGLSALHRFVLGSVSEKALHYATSSVLVVK
jgi:nucleotide-binding universal stress UspA family protein